MSTPSHLATRPRSDVAPKSSDTGRAAEIQVRDVRDLHARRALDGAVHKQTRRHIALIVLRGREPDRWRRSCRSWRPRPSRSRSPGARPRRRFYPRRWPRTGSGCWACRPCCSGKGRHDRTRRRSPPWRPAAGRWRPCAPHRRTAVADLKLRGALALGGAGGGAAAVEEDRIHHALRIQERNLLIDRHADRVRALAAVGQKGHDRAVRLGCRCSCAA